MGLKLLSALLILLISEQVYAAQAGVCGITDVHIDQWPTGKKIKGKPEFQVVVNNYCHCPQSNLRVRCAGRLPTMEPVNHRFIEPIRKEKHGICIINGGRPIKDGYPINFKYAWDKPQSFTLVSSDILCPGN